MTGPDHYRAAEFLLEEASAKGRPEGQLIAMMAAAQAHATLALVAATVDHAHDTTPHTDSTLNADEWTSVLTAAKKEDQTG